MWELIALVAGAVGAGSLIGFLPLHLDRNALLKKWREAAKAGGFTVEETSGAWAGRAGVKAKDGPLKLWIGHARGNQPGNYIVIEVAGPPGFYAVRIRSQSSERLATETDTGDPLFDSKFFVSGPQRLVTALLDAETRRLLLRADQGSGLIEIAHGQLQVRIGPSLISSLLSLLRELCQRLTQPLDVVQRLADNARHDPEAGVRLRNLLLLARELPDDPRTGEALRAACSDAAPWVRLRAAEEIGAEGRGIVLAFAESTEQDDLSVEAISFLGRDLPVERVRDILIQALRRRHLMTAHACLKRLGLNQDPADVELLAKVMAREESELAAAAAQALEALGSPAAEPALVLALQGKPPDLRVAAAHALSRFGSTAAVLPLKEAAERFPHDPDLQKATRQAVAAIQSRLPGASPGQLSLAGDEAGKLSLAQTEGGELSIADEPDGQLSLSGGEEEV
jgi:HEAT repeat protein